MYKIKSFKENKDFARCSFTCLTSSSRSQWSEVLYCIFFAYQQHVRKEKGIANKVIQTIRALMITQNIYLVVGDFNRTAWRCSSRDNISTIGDINFYCALPTPLPPLSPAPTIVGTQFHSEQKGGRLWYS